MNSFRLRLKANGMATLTNDQIKNEVLRRKSDNIFPLDVFGERIKPFLNAIQSYYDVPSSYVGVTALCAYSTAIGTAYRIVTGNNDFTYLPVWACLVGISSSGSSTTISKIFDPLFQIQNEFDENWIQKIAGLSKDKIQEQRCDTVIFRDSHMPTLIRVVLPDNPKGVCKQSEELLEWINGLNQISRKEGTDEQFWVTSWNCSTYSAIRAGKDKFVVRSPFVNVIGKSQYPLLQQLFAKNRDTSGFIFRVLFALPEEDKIAIRDMDYRLPEEWSSLHKKSITRLYKELPVNVVDRDSKTCSFSPGALKLWNTWRTAKSREINLVEDLVERDISSGILGKVSEYAMRFAAILHLVDKALEPEVRFLKDEVIEFDTMSRAIRLANYFLKSAQEVYEMVQKSLIAPPEVMHAAFMFRNRKSYSDIGEMLYGKRSDSLKVKASRQIKRWIKEYPRVFGANAK